MDSNDENVDKRRNSSHTTQTDSVAKLKATFAHYDDRIIPAFKKRTNELGFAVTAVSDPDDEQHCTVGHNRKNLYCLQI